MKRKFTIALLAVALSSSCAGAASLTGDYVEARSASVFAGPCHYGGEVESDGREAIAAWHVTTGSWDGVSLTGLNAVGVVRSDGNLGDANAQRTTLLYVDSNATDAQRYAFADAVAHECSAGLGIVKLADSTSILFTHDPASFQVSATGIARLDIAALPDKACCKQPNDVWYTPLSPVSGRMVGNTLVASCTSRTGGDPWTRGNENSAFYGTFAY